MYLRNNKDKIFMNVRTNLTEASKREKDPVCFHEADHVDLDLVLVLDWMSTLRGLGAAGPCWLEETFCRLSEVVESTFK